MVHVDVYIVKLLLNFKLVFLTGVLFKISVKYMKMINA